MAVPAMMLGTRRFLVGAARLSALGEPAGVVLALAETGVAPSLNAPFLAFASGAMLFVSVHELVPMARRYRHIGVFASGMIASVLGYAALTGAIVRLVGRTVP
jgi:ZIP family zinc transporter